ncbi:hypothetical protein HDE_11196 [Halotydeus destructor]|nr:hypothetical protein HDE_11196 [Halotydeus destructor]
MDVVMANSSPATVDEAPNDAAEFKALMNKICEDYDFSKLDLYASAAEFVKDDANSRFHDDPVAIRNFEANQDKIRKLLQQNRLGASARSNRSQDSDYAARVRALMNSTSFDKSNSNDMCDLLDILKSIREDNTIRAVDVGSLKAIAGLESKIQKQQSELEKQRAEYDKELLELQMAKQELVSVNKKNFMADRMLRLLQEHLEDNKDKDFIAIRSRWAKADDRVILPRAEVGTGPNKVETVSVATTEKVMCNREQFIRVIYTDNGELIELDSSVMADMALEKYLVLENKKVACSYCDSKCEYGHGKPDSLKARNEIKAHLSDKLKMTYGCNICSYVSETEKHRIDQHIKNSHADIAVYPLI